MAGFRAKLDYILKHNRAIYRVFNVSMSFAMRLWGKFLPMDSKLILFSSLSRKYNDSPREIYEYMIRDPKYKDYKFIWALEDISIDIPGNAVKVKADSYKYFRTALKAKYWVSAVNIERSLHFKKRACVYLNTWHGCPIKCIGNDAKGREDYDFSGINYFCYSGDYEKKIMIGAFRLQESSMLPVGLPRNDVLYGYAGEDNDYIKNQLGISSNKKVILYAPTWRDSVDNGKTYAIAPPINFDLWRKTLGEEYVILVRAHAYTNKVLNITFDDIVVDASSYPNINDLFKISDILISDYSASIIDFSILERPIICFGYDYEEYKAQRGLYWDLDAEIPNGVLKCEEEVLQHILNMDYLAECKKTLVLKQKYNQYGGGATEACVKALFEN